MENRITKSVLIAIVCLLFCSCEESGKYKYLREEYLCYKHEKGDTMVYNLRVNGCCGIYALENKTKKTCIKDTFFIFPWGIGKYIKNDK